MLEFKRVVEIKSAVFNQGSHHEPVLVQVPKFSKREVALEWVMGDKGS